MRVYVGNIGYSLWLLQQIIRCMFLIMLLKTHLGCYWWRISWISMFFGWLQAYLSIFVHDWTIMTCFDIPWYVLVNFKPVWVYLCMIVLLWHVLVLWVLFLAHLSVFWLTSSLFEYFCSWLYFHASIKFLFF